ncbi:MULTISPECIES: hypothetical protein [unclassified Haladaptatus]|nr:MULTISPECIES: hypothetical protein [unclassified Haladaptatus]
MNNGEPVVIEREGGFPLGLLVRLSVMLIFSLICFAATAIVLLTYAGYL